MTVSLRRSFRNGLAFDFNYTWSHSIDNGSSAESGAGKQGAAIQNIFNVNEFRGSSDFDIRHNISANYLFELPVGKDKALFRNAPAWLDQHCRRLASLECDALSNRACPRPSPEISPTTRTTG